MSTSPNVVAEQRTLEAKVEPQKGQRLWLDDVILLTIMAVLAACGLIYEYLLSHYAARILGTVETAIYSMIGIMIVSMGIGAFLAKWFKNTFTTFAVLEVLVALIGAAGILLVALLIAFSVYLPQYLSNVWDLPPDVIMNGGVIGTLQKLARLAPYVLGFILACMIGMEIPLIARVREALYGKHLTHNVGTVYGADYIGAGFGAAVWVMLMLSMDITLAAVLTAALNILAGLVFLLRYRQQIRWPKCLLFCHIVVSVLLFGIAINGEQWMQQMGQVLFRDKVVFSKNTQYQHLTVTKLSANNAYDFFINGRLQFSTTDEHIYHAMLVYPAMAATPRQRNILIIGGGDGLALRHVLRWQPESVTLIDLDKELVSLFSSDQFTAHESFVVDNFHKVFQDLNERSLHDPRVQIIYGDAFIEVEQLLKQQRFFDVVIIDLPDPSHPDLNKVYSDHFYRKLKLLLAADGVLVTQSTSPYHAPKAFYSVKLSLEAAGFADVQQYHENVPSFGEWGWTIASKQGLTVKERLLKLKEMPVEDRWLTMPLMLAAFEFPANFEVELEDVLPNLLGSHRMYQYHHDAWAKEQGIQ